MSVCAVMLVKDEADMIEATIRHLACHVDAILVSDNGSTDGTRSILAKLEGRFDPMIRVLDDPDPAYFQSRKTTELAMRALEQGHSWVIPCDADEIWTRPGGRRIGDYLGSLAGDVMVVRAALFDHVPTVKDNARDPNPASRIGHRKVYFGELPKVACRLRPDLVIGPGNHDARTRGTGLAIDGLQIRHFSWRSREQYVRKIRNGARAYAAAPDLPENLGVHWRMFGDPDAPDFDERVGAHFLEWFYSAKPDEDDTLTLDPAPLLRREI